MMDWRMLLSEKRLGRGNRSTSAESKARSNFERDYDRLIFSTPFRRLQNKTQVFPLPRTIFVHNRLTHSLEVSCVGRSLGNIVGRAICSRAEDCQFIPEGAIGSIVSAACLAHDLGNPPFGHSGERAISAYFKDGEGKKWQAAVQQEGDRWEDFLHFEGNANAFRLLTHQFIGRSPGGFALTYSTLASMIKYPYSSELAGEDGKFGFFATEEQTMRLIADELGLLCLSENPLEYARYPLVYLVEAADDICYQIMDIEDAYKLKLLTHEETREIFLSFFGNDERKEIDTVANNISDRNEQIAFLRAKVINALTEASAAAFLQNEEEILAGSFSSSLVKSLPEPLVSAYREASQLAIEKIYPHHAVVDVELSGHRIFGELIARMMHALEHPEEAYSKVLLSRVSSQYDTRPKTTYGRLQSTLDYISGMTDIYALDLYRKITGMSLPNI